MSGAVLFLILALAVPFIRSLFSFDVLKLTEILICLGAAIVSVAWFEIYKLVKNGIY
jgi:Ca2+-transporting ATPase